MSLYVLDTGPDSFGDHKYYKGAFCFSTTNDISEADRFPLDTALELSRDLRKLYGYHFKVVRVSD